MLAPSRQQTILINSNLFCLLQCGTNTKPLKDFNTIVTFSLFIIYVLNEYWSTLHEDDPQERVQTCRSPSVLIVTTLYFTLVHLLLYFLIY